MSKMCRVCVFILLVFSWTPAVAQGTIEDAKKMVIEASSLIHKKGAEAALSEINAGGSWMDHDIYIVIVRQDGICVADSYVPVFVGKQAMTTKDADGKYFIQEIINVKDSGWVDYKWQHPVTKKIATKKAFVLRTGDYAIFSGAYQ